MRKLPHHREEGPAPRLEIRVPLLHSPIRLLLILAVSIFLSETAIMAFLHRFPALPLLQEAMVDSFLLIVILIPALAVFMFRPLALHIRQRRLAEEALRVERDELNRILNNMPDGVSMVDREQNILFVNAVIEKEFGAVQGRKCHQYFHDLEGPCSWCKNDEVFAGNSVRWKWHSAKTGKTYDLFDTLIRDHDGTPLKLEFFHDITSLEHAEQGLRESEERYRSIFENSLDAILVTSTDGEILSANPASCRMLGRTEEELRKAGRSGLGDASDSRLHAFLEERERTGSARGELTLVRGDGTKFPAELSSALFVDHQGRHNTCLILHDITDRKNVQETVETERRRLLSLLEGLPALISLVGPDYSVRFANRYFRERFGEPGRRACYELQHGYEVPCPDCTAHGVWEGRGDRRRDATTRDGRSYRIFQYPFTDVDGSRLLLELGIDVTEQERAEAALVESEKLLRELLDGNPSLMYIRDGKGSIRLGNRALGQFYGVPLERLVGASQPELHAAAGMDMEDLRKSLLEDLEVIESGKPLFTLDPHRLPDGGVRWYRTSRLPVILADGTGCVQVIAGDITERVQAEQVLRDAHKELERRVEERTAELVRTNRLLKEVIDEKTRAEEEIRKSREELRNLSARLQSALEKERTRIAREIHDELGQSLTALRLDLSLMARRMWEDGMATLSRKAEGAARLVDTTLATVKKISAELRPFVLDELGLAAAIQWHAKEFQERTGIPCAVVVDPDEIRVEPECATALYRVFQESLRNVAQHALASRVEAKLEETDLRLVLEVRDNGVGVTDAQVRSPKSIGLIGMRERVHMFGGEVAVQGGWKKGTTVRVTIPCAGRPGADAEDPHR